MTTLYDNMTWAQEQRMRMMADMIRAYGFINRRNIERMFRISTPQASVEIARFNALWPGLLVYDASSKHYKQSVPIL